MIFLETVIFSAIPLGVGALVWAQFDPLTATGVALLTLGAIAFCAWLVEGWRG